MFEGPPIPDAPWFEGSVEALSAQTPAVPVAANPQWWFSPRLPQGITLEQTSQPASPPLIDTPAPPPPFPATQGINAAQNRQLAHAIGLLSSINDDLQTGGFLAQSPPTSGGGGGGRGKPRWQIKIPPAQVPPLVPILVPLLIPLIVPPALPPNGPAGGDLFGTYPDPFVGKIFEVPLDPTTVGTPSDGWVIQYVAVAGAYKAVPLVVSSISGPTIITNIINQTLTTNQNNYNPPGMSTATIIQINATSNINLTGIQGGSTGRVIEIQNIGTSTITLVNQSVLSLLANRLLLPQNLVIAPNMKVILQYLSGFWMGLITGPVGSAGGDLTGTYPSPTVTSIGGAAVSGDPLTQYILTTGTRAFSGPQSLGANKLTSVADPTNPQDAATKNYVDLATAALATKNDSQAATIAALPAATYFNGPANNGVGATLTGNVAAVLVLDGYTPAIGDRLLIKNQGSAVQNGIYTLTTVGTVLIQWVLTRTVDFDQPSDGINGALVFVLQGTTQGHTLWYCTATGTITFGMTNINWSQFTGNTYSADETTLHLSGTTFSIISTYTGQNTIVTLGTVTTGVWHGTIVGQAYGGTGIDTSGATDGQLLIGQSSDHSLGLATLTAGTNISITNAGHAITVTAAGNSLLRWGSIANGSGYMTVYYAANTNGANEDQQSQLTMTTGGTVSGFYVTLSAMNPGPSTDTWTVRKNGSNTGITVSIASGGSSASDTTHSVSVGAADTITVSNTGGQSVGQTGVSLGFKS